MSEPVINQVVETDLKALLAHPRSSWVSLISQAGLAYPGVLAEQVTQTFSAWENGRLIAAVCVKPERAPTIHRLFTLCGTLQGRESVLASLLEQTMAHRQFKGCAWQLPVVEQVRADRLVNELYKLFDVDREPGRGLAFYRSEDYARQGNAPSKSRDLPHLRQGRLV